MLSLKDFKKFDLGLNTLNNFTGGIDEGFVGCLDCNGRTIYCRISSGCQTMTCRDLPGEPLADRCGASAVSVGVGHP